MQSFSLHAVAAEQLAAAQVAPNGRSASTLHVERQDPPADGAAEQARPAARHTVLALIAGQALAEHESPGEATLQVLRGRVQLATAGDSWEGSAGDLLVIPGERHDLRAIDDSVVLLTVHR